MNCDDASLSIQECNIDWTDHKAGVHRATSRKPQHAWRTAGRYIAHRSDEPSQTSNEMLCHLKLAIVPP